MKKSATARRIGSVEKERNKEITLKQPSNDHKLANIPYNLIKTMVGTPPPPHLALVSNSNHPTKQGQNSNRLLHCQQWLPRFLVFVCVYVSRDMPLLLLLLQFNVSKVSEMCVQQMGVCCTAAVVLAN